MEDRKINVTALKDLLVRVLRQIDAGSTISVDRNYYWSIPEDRVYEMREKPPDFDVGSLWDDLEFVKQALNDPELNSALLLDHIIPLLTYVNAKSKL